MVDYDKYYESNAIALKKTAKTKKKVILIDDLSAKDKKFGQSKKKKKIAAT